LSSSDKIGYYNILLKTAPAEKKTKQNKNKTKKPIKQKKPQKNPPNQTLLFL